MNNSILKLKRAFEDNLFPGADDKELKKRIGRYPSLEARLKAAYIEAFEHLNIVSDILQNVEIFTGKENEEEWKVADVQTMILDDAYNDLMKFKTKLKNTLLTLKMGDEDE